MQYTKLGQTDLEISRLTLGTMTMGWTADKPTSFALLDYAVEQGITLLETADIYSMWVEGNDGGVAESWLGEWLTSRRKHGQVHIATKARGRMWEGPDGEGLSRAHLMRAVEDSLRRLQVETIDLYQSHWADADTPLEETFRAFDDMIRQGKVRYIGCSNHNPAELQATLDTCAELGLPRYESLQPHYNLVHRAEYEAELMRLCQHHGLGVLPYSPLAGGFLTGKYTRNNTPPNSRGSGNDRLKRYTTPAGFAIVDALTDLATARQTNPATIALAWNLANPTVSSVIIGANRVEQLAQTIHASDITLTDEEMARLDGLPSPT